MRLLQNQCPVSNCVCDLLCHIHRYLNSVQLWQHRGAISSEPRSSLLFLSPLNLHGAASSNGRFLLAAGARCGAQNAGTAIDSRSVASDFGRSCTIAMTPSCDGSKRIRKPQLTFLRLRRRVYQWPASRYNAGSFLCLILILHVTSLDATDTDIRRVVREGRRCHHIPLRGHRHAAPAAAE